MFSAYTTRSSGSLRRAIGKILLSGCVLAAGTVNAQQNSTSNDESGYLEEVIVTGIRASQQQNLEIKRNSNAIVDAITAVDIGRFPDKNVADSLQRVPGVVIARDGGEGSTVSIRGLSSELTFTQLNGNYIAPTGSGGEPSRSFDYALLPSAMISRVEVYKSSEARLDEGGVGGTVILHTRKPLESEANLLLLNAEGTYADVTEDVEPSFSGLYSWKNDAESFGVLFGWTRQDRTNRSLTGFADAAGGYRFATSGDDALDVNGNPFPDSARRFAPLRDANGGVTDGVWIPQVVGGGVLKEDRQREGIQLSSQWRPTERVGFEFNLFRFTLGQDRTSSEIQMPEWSLNPNYLVGLQLDPSGSIVTGVDYTAGASGAEGNLQFPWIIGSFTREESESNTLDLAFDYQGDGLQIRAKIGHTEASGGPTEQWRAAYKSGAPASFTASGLPESAARFAGWRLNDRVSLYADPNLIDNLNAGIGGENDPGSTDSSFVVNDYDEDYLQLDVDFDVGWGIFDRIRAGVKHRNTSVFRQTKNTFFLLPEVFDEIAAGREVETSDQYQHNGGMPGINEILNPGSQANVIGGFEINIMPTINWDRYRALVTSQFPRFTRNEDEFVFGIDEKITAAYIQGDFGTDTIRGNIGLRYVRTSTDALSSDILELFLDQNDDATGEPLSGDIRERSISTVLSRSNTSTHLLPSFNFVWDLREDLLLRFAVSQTISRPNYGDLGAQERLIFISEEWAEDRLEFNDNPTDAGWSGSGGNKDLEPFESIQFDLSIEYYYGNASAVGAALFNKDVDNFIVPLQISSARDFAGVDGVIPAGSIVVEPFSTSGNGTDATSRGIELFVQHAFDNGFGVAANYTYNDTNRADVSVDGTVVGESELVGSAKNQSNLSVYYENDLFSARASYNRRGDVVLGLQDGITVFADAYRQIDLNARYNLTEKINFTASVINLTEEEEFTRLGDDTSARLLTSLYAGRRVYLGVNYRF